MRFESTTPKDERLRDAWPWCFTLFLPIQRNRQDAIRETILWTIERYGYSAGDLYLPTESRWALDLSYEAIFYFNREEDAFDFKIRWA